MMLMIVSVNQSDVLAASDYTTDSYTINTVVHKDHSADITEKIVVDFGNSAHHGIYRYVPYVSSKYTINDVKVKNENVDTSDESSNGHSYILIKIGNANKTVTGKHTYNITYKMTCYSDRDTSHDSFSYNLFPTLWETSIKSVKSTITMPKSVNASAYKFYGGLSGSKSMPSYFKTSVSNHGKTIVLTGSNVPAKSGATVNARLQEGYWVNPPDHFKGTSLVMAGCVIFAILVFLMWLRHGRDPDLVETVEFHPPEGMTPVDIGYVIDDVVDTKDVTSLLMYYASQGLVSFEVKGKKMTVHKLKEISNKEKSYVKDFFNGFFVKKDMNLQKLPASVGEVYEDTKEEVVDYYTTAKTRLYDSKADACRILSYVIVLFLMLGSAALVGYYDYDMISYLIFGGLGGLVVCFGMRSLNQGYDRRIGYSKAKTGVKFIVGTVVTLIGVFIHLILLSTFEDSLVMIVYVLSMLVIVIFSMLMRALTPHGASLLGKVYGFKNFIATAEYERLKMLSEENPEYFYDILPYAYVMGMDKTWAKKFDKIKVRKPSWYMTDDDMVVRDMIFYDMMMHNFHDMSRSIDMSVKESASAAMSDFTGGGGGGDFSGGGFGGGGGGAW
jgi:uncharacterized membrane protein YgcG